MKRFVTIALICLFAASPAMAGGRGQGRNRNKNKPEETPLQELTAEEIADLTHMREEEKLARDVYLALYAEWDLAIFANISASEQRHMDAVGGLLEKYGIEDPVGDNAKGVFTNGDLQSLYDTLVATGRKSLIDALTVGATIEDLDIYDLLKAVGRTDKVDILAVYQNLLKGSRNHMRAFVGQLEQRDVTYAPQYISQEQFDEIVNSPKERGRVDANGESAGPGGGKGRGHRRGRGGRGGGAGGGGCK